MRPTALAVLFLALPASAQLTAADAQPESYAIARGVLVAPALRTVYVLSRGEPAGIEALDVRTLQRRARSTEALLPLVVAGRRLLVLSAAGAPLRLAWLDAQTLRVIESCTPVSLPDWIQPSARDGLGSSFELRAERSGSAIYVRYTASRGYVGGVPPTPEQRAASERSAEGSVRVALSGGTAEATESAPPERAPQAFGMEVPYVAGPFARGPLELTVSVDEEVRVSRRRRSDGAELAPLRMPCESGLAILSLERSALLIADNGPDGTLASARLVDSSSGKRLARIRLVEPPETFVIANGYLIFTSSDSLHSVQIGAGAHTRTRALQPTRYTGPYPPSARGGSAL